MRTPVSGYTLAVSWSPEYCHGDTSSMQCSGRNGRFGFVLHGLWPEARSGPSPQWCSLTPRPSPDLIRQNLCMTPVPSLLAHEWAKHGSCMTRTPEAYFRTSSILWRSLRWPDADRLSRQEGLSVGDLRKAVIASNPDWRGRRDWACCWAAMAGCANCGSAMIAASCPPIATGAAFGPPDSAPLKIWRGL